MRKCFIGILITVLMLVFTIPVNGQKFNSLKTQAVMDLNSKFYNPPSPQGYERNFNIFTDTFRE